MKKPSLHKNRGNEIDDHNFFFATEWVNQNTHCLCIRTTFGKCAQVCKKNCNEPLMTDRVKGKECMKRKMKQN